MRVGNAQTFRWYVRIMCREKENPVKQILNYRQN